MTCDSNFQQRRRFRALTQSAGKADIKLPALWGQLRGVGLTLAILAGVSLLSGCKDPATVKREIDQAVANERLAASRQQAQAVREVRAQSLAQSNAASAQARRDGFQAGQAAATAEVNAKVRQARKDAFDQGKIAGAASAAVENFERGLAAERAKADGEELGYAEGVTQGELRGKLSALGQNNLPFILVAVLLVVALFFALHTSARRRTDELQKRLDEEDLRWQQMIEWLRNQHVVGIEVSGGHRQPLRTIPPRRPSSGSGA